MNKNNYNAKLHNPKKKKNIKIKKKYGGGVKDNNEINSGICLYSANKQKEKKSKIQKLNEIKKSNKKNNNKNNKKNMATIRFSSSNKYYFSLEFSQDYK